MTDQNSIAPAGQDKVILVPDTAREVFPMSMGLDADDQLYDFRPVAREPLESPDPKALSAVESADSSETVVEEETPENSGVSSSPQPDQGTLVSVVKETPPVLSASTKPPSS